MFNITLVGGLISSIIFSAIVLLSWRYTPEVWLHDLTDGAVESPRTPPAYIVFISIIATLLIGSTASAWSFAAGGPTTFFQRFLIGWFVIAIINLVDLVIIDWLIYIKIYPRFMQVEGVPPLNQLWPHVRGLFIGLATGVPIALIGALVTMWV